jgi:signal transduction histidine kinase
MPTQTILTIEDDAAIRRGVVDALTFAGYQVIEAAATAPGVGLGLALCRRLAKQLGGQLEVTDSKDGTSAVLHLPLGAAAES